MQKILAGLFLTAASFIVVSCSNFAFPERVHVKTQINPNIPVNSSEFNFSEKFQQELNKMFTDSENIKVINYTGDPDSNIQQFLISFPLHEQSLDFQEYLGNTMNEDLESINQTFKVDAPKPENTTISIDTKAQMEQILDSVTLGTAVIPIPGSPGLRSIPLPLTGFSSLSFYTGELELTFAFDQEYTGGLNYLTIHSSMPEVNSISGTITSAPNQSAKVSFPLAGKVLAQDLSLSFYSSSSRAMSLVNVGFSSGTKIKTATGVTFSPTNNANLPSNEINFGLSSEFVQATVKTGSVAIDTSALAGIALNLDNMRINQALNDKVTNNHGGVDLQTGLDLTGLITGQSKSLEGQLLNPNPAQVSGTYSLSVTDPANSEITFNIDGTLKIPIAFTLESFSQVYINARQMINDFNGTEGKRIINSLADLSKTVRSVTLKEAGLNFSFGEVIDGLSLTVNSQSFFNSQEKTQRIAAKETQKFTEEYDSLKPYPINPDTVVDFTLNLTFSDPSSSTILRLTDVKTGDTVTVLECTPQFVFDWVEATIEPQKSGSGNDFTQGEFPSGGSGFEIGELDMLQDFEFKHIDAYLFFSGPTESDGITLALTAYKNDTIHLYPLPSNANSIKIVQTVLELPEGDEPFTEDIAARDYSTKEYGGPIDFTETFNRMLDGDALNIEYNMDFTKGISIKKDDMGEVNVFKADLVIVVPLELLPKDKANGANLDVSDYLGGMVGTNLLSFADDSSNISINTLTLNITLTGMPADNGLLQFKTVEGENFDINLNSQYISIPLAEHLGPNQSFTPDTIILKIPSGGSLRIPRDFSLLSFSVNAGVDVTFDL